MKKQEFVAAIAEKTGFTKKDVEAFIKAQTEVMTEALVENRTEGQTVSVVSIPSFGTFKVSYTQGRTGVNPKTKEEMEIPASYAARFSASSALKEALKA